MGSKRPRLDSCSQCMKLTIIIGGSFIGIFGIIVMGIGIYLSADQLDFVAKVFMTEILSASSALLVIAGGVTFLVCILGCLGAFLQNRKALTVFVIGMCLVYLLSASGVALSVVFRSWITQQLRSHMTLVLQHQYGVNLNNTENEIATKNWDKAQQKWYCCGIDPNGWGVYRNSEWYNTQPGIIEFERPAVPESCCRKNQYGAYIHLSKCQTFYLGPPNKQSGKYNEAVFYKGCYEAGNDVLYGISLYLIIIGFVLGATAIAAAMVSIILIRRL